MMILAWRLSIDSKQKALPLRQITLENNRGDI